MMEAQSILPDHIELVNDEPLNDLCDITWRYRTGYDRLKNKGFDIIFLIENDDYYAPNYIEFMIDKWIQHGRTDIFGNNFTYYYHLKLKAYFRFQHYGRASAMNTMLKPDLDIKWPEQDHEPYTDLHLWRNLKGTAIDPDKLLSIGLKHGKGLCGGRSHSTHLDRYDPKLKGVLDHDLSFLKEHMDPISFKFYSNYGEIL